MANSSHIFEVWALPSSARIECKVVELLIKGLPNVDIPIPGFGSSDCKSHCAAHLLASNLSKTQLLKEVRNLLYKSKYYFRSWEAIQEKNQKGKEY
jgi:Uri superfamily endonuclease